MRARTPARVLTFIQMTGIMPKADTIPKRNAIPKAKTIPKRITIPKEDTIPSAGNLPNPNSPQGLQLEKTHIPQLEQGVAHIMIVK